MIQSKFTTIEELKKLVTKIIEQKKYTLLLLEGNLGAGKTTFVKELVHQLGSEDTVTSPTFSLINEYRTKKGIVYHFDLYRIKNEQELYNIGFNEYIDSGNLCCIEWPELCKKDLPKHHIISLTLENQERILKFTES